MQDVSLAFSPVNRCAVRLRQGSEEEAAALLDTNGSGSAETMTVGGVAVDAAERAA